MRLIFVDLDTAGKGLVREAIPLSVSHGVHSRAADQEPKGFLELLAGALVLFVFVDDAPVNVAHAFPDAVLVALQRVEVDGVGEVRGEDLVGLAQSIPELITFRGLQGTGGGGLMSVTMVVIGQVCSQADEKTAAIGGSIFAAILVGIAAFSGLRIPADAHA